MNSGLNKESLAKQVLKIRFFNFFYCTLFSFQWLEKHTTHVGSLPVFDNVTPNHVLVNEYEPGQGIMVRIYSKRLRVNVFFQAVASSEAVGRMYRIPQIISFKWHTMRGPWVYQLPFYKICSLPTWKYCSIPSPSGGVHLSPGAKMAHRASTCAFHWFLPCTAVRTSLQDCHPALDLSFSTVRRQVVFVRPLFLFPSGAHVRAVTQSLSSYLFSEDVSNETPSPSSYLFAQPLPVSPFQ